MSKYRIIVENIGDGADWDGTEYECDGFAIIADKGKDGEAAIQDLSVSQLAVNFAGEDNFFMAACIAKAMREAVNLPQAPIAKNPLAAMFASMAGDD